MRIFESNTYHGASSYDEILDFDDFIQNDESKAKKFPDEDSFFRPLDEY
ncbi:MAG: hypothetical protein AAF616_01030 [Bacteroidota bacterium]